jgi:hypothetical protein
VEPRNRNKSVSLSAGPVHQGLNFPTSGEFLFSVRPRITAGGNGQCCSDVRAVLRLGQNFNGRCVAGVVQPVGCPLPENRGLADVDLEITASN